jgi:hypothetical protein
MAKTKGNTLMRLFREEQEMIEGNLVQAQSVLRKGDRAKSLVLLEAEDADKVFELIDEVLQQLDLSCERFRSSRRKASGR